MLTFEDFVERSQEAGTAAELKTIFERLLGDEGFENSYMGKVVGGRISETYWANFPTGHFENYLAEGWQDIDPILAFTARARRPFVWDQEASRMQFDTAQKAFLDECQRVGMSSFVMSPIHEPGGICHIVGASMRHPELPDPKRVPILQACFAQLWCRSCPRWWCRTAVGAVVGSSFP